MSKKRKPEGFGAFVFRLDEGLEIVGADEKYVTVRLKVEDLPRLKLMKLPKDVREYWKKEKRKYRQKVKAERH